MPFLAHQHPALLASWSGFALDFAAAKTEFLAGYDAAVTDWVVRHPNLPHH